MKISTKGRYALRFLTDLNAHAGEGFISLKDVAERQEISKKYLEQIVALLGKTGMICTNRGQAGGYRLNKPADAITIAEILRVTEGGLSPVPCLEDAHGGCSRRESCPTLPVWQGLQERIESYLSGITLQTLSDQTK